MAVPVEFPQQNDVLKPAKGTESWVSPLPIYRQFPDGVNDACVVSAWQLTDEEKAAVAETGVVYIQASGVTHPPIAVYGSSPFAPALAEKAPEQQ